MTICHPLPAISDSGSRSRNRHCGSVVRLLNYRKLFKEQCFIFTKRETGGLRFYVGKPRSGSRLSTFFTGRARAIIKRVVIHLCVTMFTQNASQGNTHHMDIYAGDDSMSDGRECLDRTGGTTRHNTVIKIAEVSYQTGLSRATIYREIKAGNFPKQLQLSPQRVGWLQCEIDAWKSACRRGSIVKTEQQQGKALQKALNNNDQSQFPKLVST